MSEYQRGLEDDDDPPRSEACCNCGDVDGVCASAGGELYCGPCWEEYQREKAARKAARLAAPTPTEEK